MARIYRFPPEARIRKTREFDNVFKNGCKFVEKNVVVYYHPNSRPLSRLGVIVPKRVGRAVTRNRVKRQVREIFRINREDLSAGVDIVVIARKNAGIAGFLQMKEELLGRFERVRGSDGA